MFHLFLRNHHGKVRSQQGLFSPGAGPQSKVSCQQLIPMGSLKERGLIPAGYKVIETFSDSIALGLTSSSIDDEQILRSAPEVEVEVFPTTASVTAAESSTEGQEGPMLISTLDAELTSTDASFATIEDSAMLVLTPDAEAEVMDVASASSLTAGDSTKSINSDYFLWTINRYSKKAPDSDYVPGFTAARSTTTNCKFHPTTTILTPILPYPATTYDAVFTTMVNFQDALKQKGDAYGALWADEGVYRIAKEIQLLKSDQFDNIFLGLGGFHMEKIVLACLGL